MGKKSKIGGAAALAYGVLNQTGIVPDADDIYNVGKEVVIGTKSEIEKQIKKDKIRKLLIEIGDRIISKNIGISDKEISDEIECINELEEKIEELCTK